MLFNNPIGLVSDGKVQEFDALRDFYRRVLELLHHDFPRGCIDYKLFLYDHTLLRGTPLGKSCRAIERGWDASDGFCIEVSWTCKLRAPDTLTDLMRKLMRHVAGTSLELAEFDAAWRTFCRTALMQLT